MDIDFNADGSQMFVITIGGELIVYNLSTPFDLSTISYNSIGFYTGSEELNPYGLSFSTDGTMFFVIGATGDVHQYQINAAVDFAENVTGTVTDVDANDGDGGATDSGITYSLASGGDNDLFNINSSTGVLTFKSAPDYETSGDADTDNVYEITVTADDGASSNNTTTLDIYITVTDVAENTPPTASNFIATSSPYQNVVYTFATSDFGYSDGDSDPLDHVRITAVPSSGTLYVDANSNDILDLADVQLSNNGQVSKTVLDAGNLQYYTTGKDSTTFTFDVYDGDDYSSITYTAALNVIPAVTVSITSQTNVSCNGESDGSLTATVTPGAPNYNYSWSNGSSTSNTSSTTNTISGLSAGTFKVTVTDAVGNTDSISATITEPAVLEATAIADSMVSCNGSSDGGATASATGGIGSYTYLWSNSATTASITGVTAGTYKVWITDVNGCIDSASIEITEPESLVASTTVDSMETRDILNNGGATASATGGTTPYSYSWSNGATTTFITGVGAGTYTITITDAKGCSSESSFNIVQYVAGDVDENGIIDGTEIAGDADGDGSIDGSEIAGDSDGDGSIGTGEIAGDNDGDGSIESGEIAGDTDGDGTVETGEIAGDSDGDGSIGTGEIAGDTDGDGSIGSGEIAGDTDGSGSIGNGEIAGDSNGDGSIGGSEITGDTNGDGSISEGEVEGDTDGNGLLDVSEDYTPPVIKCNAKNIYLDKDGRYILSTPEIRAFAKGTTDNVDDFDDLKITVSRRGFNCSQVDEDLEAKVTVTDKAGNQSTCWADIKVYPPVAYKIDPVDDVLATAAASECGTIITYPDFINNKCALYTQIEGLGPDSIFPIGTTTETWVKNSTVYKDTVSFDVIVMATNANPTLDAIIEVQTNEDVSIDVELTGISAGNDCEDQEITISTNSSNTDLIESLNVDYVQGDTTASLAVTLVPDASGPAEITVIVEDELGATVERTFTVIVSAVNDAPYLVNPLTDQLIPASYVLSIPISPDLGKLFNDNDNDELILKIMVEGTDTLPDWTTISEDMFVLKPMIEDTGCVNIIVEGSDGELTASDTFQVCVAGYPTGITDIGAGKFEVNLYPNPTKGMVNVDIQSAAISDVELTILSITGEQVLRKKYRAAQLITFDMSERVSGMYFVKLDFEGHQVLKKLIVRSLP